MYRDSLKRCDMPAERGDDDDDDDVYAEARVQNTDTDLLACTVTKHVEESEQNEEVEGHSYPSLCSQWR